MDLEGCPCGWGGEEVSIQVQGTALSAALLRGHPVELYFTFLIKAKQMIDVTFQWLLTSLLPERLLAY